MIMMKYVCMRFRFIYTGSPKAPKNIVNKFEFLYKPLIDMMNPVEELES